MIYEGYRSIKFRHSNTGILDVAIANPRSALNTVDEDLHSELGRLFRELKRDDRNRAVLLHGEGKAFSAGGDFAFLEAMTPDKLYNLRRDGKQLIWDLLDVEIPIVAAVHGSAAGLGASIALLCDVIFMAEDAKILDPHVKVGIVAGDGGAAIWPLVLGPARAKQYLMTGDAITGIEAAQMGLVNKAVPADQLLETAHAFALRLAEGAPLAVRYTKLAVNQLIKQALATTFDYSTALELATFASEDRKEALEAIRDKRPPFFQGR